MPFSFPSSFFWVCEMKMDGYLVLPEKWSIYRVTTISWKKLNIYYLVLAFPAASPTYFFFSQNSSIVYSFKFFILWHKIRYVYSNTKNYYNATAPLIIICINHILHTILFVQAHGSTSFTSNSTVFFLTFTCC